MRNVGIAICSAPCPVGLVWAPLRSVTNVVTSVRSAFALSVVATAMMVSASAAQRRVFVELMGNVEPPGGIAKPCDDKL